MKVLAVIPARLHSTRLDNKPLVDIIGKPLIQHVYERVIACTNIDKVIIATDHIDILKVCQGFGAHVEMTKANHPSGTDRVGEVANRYTEYDVIINVQGDEPLLDPAHVNDLLDCFEDDKVEIATLAQKVISKHDFNNPNVVKLVKSINNRVLYFSRSAIPFDRDGKANYVPLKHVGLYAFRRKVLSELIRLPQSELEKTEKLEQLRWMDHGYSIHCRINNIPLLGIDTPEDLERFKKRLLQK